MPRYVINETIFFERLERLYTLWKSKKSEEWNKIDAFEVSVGRVEEDTPEYQRNAILQTWLLGYEFTDTIMVFTLKPESCLYALTSKKKADLLRTLKETAIAAKSFVKLKIIEKADSDMGAQLEEIINPIKGKILGVLAKEKQNQKGPFATAWYQRLDSEVSIKQVDIERGIAQVLAKKSPEEVAEIKKAAVFSAKILKKYFGPEMESIVDDEKQVPHSKLAEDTDSAIVEPAKTKVKVLEKFKSDSLDTCFPTSIQSGGKYNITSHITGQDMSHAAQDNLHFGTIICTLGAKHKSYCSTVARTYMIDSSTSQKENYSLLIEIYNLVVKKLKAVGTPLSEVYQAALDLLRKKKPEIADNFLDMVGYGIGLEPYESYLKISRDNNVLIEEGMCFVIFIGFQEIEDDGPAVAKDEKRKTYSLLVADTCAVTANDVEVFTSEVEMDYDSISYSFEDDEPQPKNSLVLPQIEDDRQGKVTRSKEKAGVKKSLEDQRKEKQDELLRKKREEFQKRKENAKTGSSSGDVSTEDKLSRGEAECYKNGKDIPLQLLKSNKICVDDKNGAVLLPINGTHVPFHISTIKNVSKSEEGEFMFLRINFKSAGVSFGKVYAPAKQYPNATFLKEISYRAKDPKNLIATIRAINELRKKVTQQDRDQNEKRSIVAQEPLKVTRGAAVPRLREVYIRPNPKGKKTVGTLEAHENGLRFVSNKGETVDILYANVMHAFYQEARTDTIVLLHFHLRNSIMIGKKGQTDIQFYTEVMEEYDQLVGRFKRNMTDAESIEEERREKELKKKLNEQFRNFANKIAEIAPEVEVDAPYRDLEFVGTPNRTNVTLTPTVHCLVNLTEYPFFVLTLEDVEIAYFERVKFGLRNFDLVFVPKDYTKATVQINSIPIEKLEIIKDWLNNVEIKYFEGPTNLVWPKIMKTIREDKSWDPWGTNGWQSFLDDEPGEEEEDDEEMQQEGYEEYVPSGGEESEDDYRDEEDEEESQSEASDDEEGESWEALEREAKEADHENRKRHGSYSDDEEEKRPAKKQRTKK